MTGLDPDEVAFLTALGGQVRHLRRLRGWTQGELAAVAGLTLNMVRKTETAAHSTTVLTCRRLARALRVDLGQLLAGNAGGT